jgi:peptidoglycan/LPS O-acetylase OafA/YrhL
MGKTPATTSFFVPGYIPQFDGVRGVAVLMVLIGHSGFLEQLPHTGMLEYARFSVDSYFVLSGFLITGILLDSKGSEHYFRNFYARRAVRIWPLYYLVLLLVFVVEPLFAPAMRATVASIWPAFAFYVQNLIYHDAYPFGLAATWSLAVEEQFYITWPLLIFLLKKRTLTIVLFSLFVVSLSLRLGFYFRGAASGFVHQYTFSRLDAITFGSLAALWIRSPSCTLFRWRKCSHQFLFIGASGMVLARILMHRNSSVVGYTFLGIMYTGLIGLLLVSDTRSSLLGRSFSARWLRYMGRISYGIYLLHYPLFTFWARFINSGNFLPSNPVARNLLAFGGQIAMATMAGSISWHFFEEPILRFKGRFPSGSTMHSRTGGDVPTAQTIAEAHP